jgi:RimJ/RimL family protein N-acetyltransferase
MNASEPARWIVPVTLSGTHVVLEPLAPSHRDGLVAAASDGRLWELWYTLVPAPETIDAWLEAAFAMRDTAGAQPFVVRTVDATGAPAETVGTTRLFNVDARNRRVEIGHTWYAKGVQRTAVNTETKLLLLTHAFETLGAAGVEFRTHFFNFTSRNAIARLGARQDGILRHHQIMPDGSYRDTVVFSIIQPEWTAVKAHLEFRLRR